MHSRLFRSSELRSLLLTIVRTTAASSCLVGCAASHGPEKMADNARDDDDDAVPGAVDASTAREAALEAVADLEWAPLACDANIALPDDVKATRPTWYLSVQEDVGHFESSDGGVTRYHVTRAHVGPGCAGSTHMAACEQALNALGGRGCGAAPRCTFVLTGSDGAFTRIDRRAELLSLLGDIDLAGEAAILAVFDGHDLCSVHPIDARAIGTEISRSSDGFLLRTTRDVCEPRGLYQEILKVTTDGAVSVVSHVQLREPICVPGRRPAGLCDAPERSVRGARAYLAEAAEFEAASVIAFSQLLRELRLHNAPAARRARSHAG
jgi:hypothetical protein